MIPLEKLENHFTKKQANIIRDANPLMIRETLQKHVGQTMEPLCNIDIPNMLRGLEDLNKLDKKSFNLIRTMINTEIHKIANS